MPPALPEVVDYEFEAKLNLRAHNAEDGDPAAQGPSVILH